MKIVCISDTHMSGMPLRGYPEADVLIHSGDATYRGREEEVRHFAKELSKHLEDSRHHRGYKQVIFVPGNHDWLFEKDEPLARKIMTDHGITTLINESYSVDGFKIWGSPVTPPFHGWAFNWEDQRRYDLWESIPQDTDIIVTHGPPRFIRDEVREYMKVKHCGCEHLAQRIKSMRLEGKGPSLHVFGHIHEGYGVTEQWGTKFVNPSIMDGGYRSSNLPILVELDEVRT